MIFLQIIVGVIVGLAWFTSGVIFPIASCAMCDKWEVEDYYMIPLCGILGPFSLWLLLSLYARAKKKKAAK